MKDEVDKTIIRICPRCKNTPAFLTMKYCEECNKVILKERYVYEDTNKKRKRFEFYKKNKDNPFTSIIRRLSNRNALIKKYRNDKSHAIAVRLRRLVNYSLNEYSISGKIQSSKKYCIDYRAIIEHLKPFPKDLSKYHIDHIKPLCSFNLEDKEEVKKAFAPENHQWLLAEDNRKKIKQDKQMSLRRKLQ